MRRRQRRAVVRFSDNGPLMYPRLLDIVADAAFVARTLDAESLFRKCGEKSETSEHKLIFGNKTAGLGCLKLGSGRQVSVFHPTSELVAHLALSMSPHPLKKFLKQP